jgi:hypothetical protein
MRADAEAPMRAVVDFALTFPEVDAQRLAVYGISGGGYLAPRAAAFDPRIKALVVNTILLNFTDHWIQNAGLDRVVRLQDSLLFRALAAFHSRKLATVMNQLQIYCWRWGVQRVEDLIEVSRSFVLDPSRLTCPTYILIGEHEYQSSAISRTWIEETRQKAQGRVDLFVGPTDEGTNSHTMGTNLSLMSQMVFDWLDELFCVHPMGKRRKNDPTNGSTPQASGRHCANGFSIWSGGTEPEPCGGPCGRGGASIGAIGATAGTDAQRLPADQGNLGLRGTHAWANCRLAVRNSGPVGHLVGRQLYRS